MKKSGALPLGLTSGKNRLDVQTTTSNSAMANNINQENKNVNNLKYKKGVLRLLFYSLRTNCRQISAISDMTHNTRFNTIQNEGLLLSNIKAYPIIPQTMTTINSI